MLSIENIAKLCYETNRQYCQLLGDYSQSSWCETSEELRNSAIAGVKHILSGNVTSPEESHNSWITQRYSDGWRYGTIKSEKEKTHPCLVDYENLPEEHRIKDYIFFGLVNSLREFVVGE